MPGAQTNKSKSAAKTKATKVEKLPKSDVKQKAKIEIPVETPVAAKPATPIYSKYNPLIFSNKAKKSWNFGKYGLALALAVFAILSLYMASMWQMTLSWNEELRITEEIGTLEHLRVTDGAGSWLFLKSLTDAGIIIDAALLSQLNAASTALSIESASLFQLSKIFSEAQLSVLTVFSIIGIVSLIPLLVFKNATRWSVICISFSSVVLIVVIIFFSIGIAAQNEILGPVKQINSLISQYSAYKGSGTSDAYADQMTNILSEIDRLIAQLTEQLAASAR